MYELPTFQRAPRIYTELPKGEMEIPAPPSAPTAPTFSPVTVLLPGLAALGGLAFAVYTLMQPSGFKSPLILLSFGFMLVNAATAGVNYVSQKRKYKKTTQEREEKYRALLKARTQELAALRDKQQTVLRQTDPEPLQCLARIERLNRRLWERSTGDSDFLSVRLGLGAQPSAINIKP